MCLFSLKILSVRDALKELICVQVSRMESLACHRDQIQRIHGD